MSLIVIRAQDAVTAGNLPTEALFGFYYVDGRFANEAAVRARCPRAKLQSITVFGGDADICDSETGDLDIPRTLAWVERRLAAGAYRPGVYANRDRWENLGLLAALEKYGQRIKRWQASFDGVAAIPPGYDAKQFADPGPVDLDICLESFFDTAAPKPVPVVKKPEGHAFVLITIDLAHKTATHRHIHGTASWGSKDETLRLELDYGLGGKDSGVTRLRQM